MRQVKVHPLSRRLIVVPISNLGDLSIISAEIVCTPLDTKIDFSEPVIEGNQVTFFEMPGVDGKENGDIYDIDVVIELSNGEKIVPEFSIRVDDRESA